MTSAGSAMPPMGLALPDIGLARLPGQFALKVTADRQWVTHQVAAWSVGLRWLTFEYDNTVYDPDSPLFIAGLDEEYLATVEQQPFERWLQFYLARHREMHDAALTHGLAPGGKQDLPIERFQIDRLLKAILASDGVDVHGPAETMASNVDFMQFLANCMDHMQTYVEGMRFQLSQADGCLPVLSAELPMGGAIYHGFALDVGQRLPEVIRDGIIGRRLADLVSTGFASLDCRIITEVFTSWEDVPDRRLGDGWTRLQLEPDLVELGS